MQKMQKSLSILSGPRKVEPSYRVKLRKNNFMSVNLNEQKKSNGNKVKQSTCITLFIVVL